MDMPFVYIAGLGELFILFLQLRVVKQSDPRKVVDCAFYAAQVPLLVCLKGQSTRTVFSGVR